MFSNCDRELLLWIDGSVVKFDSPTTYGDLGNTRPTESDLSPVGMASQGAKMKLSHLKVFRDIYYIAEWMNRRCMLSSGLYKRLRLIHYPQGKVDQFFSDPTQWSDFDESNMRQVEFHLKGRSVLRPGRQ